MGTKRSQDGSALVTPIRSLRPGLQDVNLRFIMLERLRALPSNDGQVHTWLVADESGAVELSLYDHLCDAFAEAEIVELRGGNTQLHKDHVVLLVGTGDTKRVGEFTLAFSETPNMSQPGWRLDAKQPRNLLLATVMAGAEADAVGASEARDAVQTSAPNTVDVSNGKASMAILLPSVRDTGRRRSGG